MRFECDRGEGFARLFSETFSFHADKHDPAELYLQLDDLARKPRLLSPRAHQRDVDLLLARLVLGIPRYLEQLLDRLETGGRLDEATLVRTYEDVALVAQTLSRFVSEHPTLEGRGLRLAAFHLRKLLLRCLRELMERRVSAAYREAYVEGRVDPVDPADDLSEAGFFATLEGDDGDAVDRSVVRLAERAFYRWLEDVCLDEENRAFEMEDSPFADRETEVRRAISGGDGGDILRARDLSPFLRRVGNRDCQRVLDKLSRWFLRQYDIHHASAMLHHADDMNRGRIQPDRVLSRHRTRNYVLTILLLASPYLVAAFAYERAPRLFDAIGALEVALAGVAVLWFLLYRFCWKRELVFFHASVPRIAAGIIVGYLPIFFIDEVWSLANRSWVILTMVAMLLAFTTLLYLYVEVQRRLGDVDLAFARARQIFLLGLLQAFGAGLVITGLTGSFMASRNWASEPVVGVEVLRETLPPFVGELPRIVGIEPLYTFPAAVFVMAFMSFFIGTFLQLLWEDIPITDPL